MLYLWMNCIVHNDDVWFQPEKPQPTVKGKKRFHDDDASDQVIDKRKKGQVSFSEDSKISEEEREKILQLVETETSVSFTLYNILKNCTLVIYNMDKWFIWFHLFIYNSKLSLLNELTGFYRGTSNFHFFGKRQPAPIWIIF